MLALPGTYFCGSDLCIVKHSQRLPFLCSNAASLTSRYFSSWIDKWIFPSSWQWDLTLHSYKSQICASAELPPQGFGEFRIWWLPSPLFGWMMWQTLPSSAVSLCLCSGSAQIIAPLKTSKNWKRDCVVLADGESSIQGLWYLATSFQESCPALNLLTGAPNLTLLCAACWGAEGCQKWAVHHLIYNSLPGTSPVPA